MCVVRSGGLALKLSSFAQPSYHLHRDSDVMKVAVGCSTHGTSDKIIRVALATPDSIVADATRIVFIPHRWLKPTATVTPPRCGGARSNLLFAGERTRRCAADD